MKQNTWIIGLFLLVINPAGAAQYFKDNFSWGYDNQLWRARNGDNGTPFGCVFNDNAIAPSSQGITLSLANGTCSELQTRQFYSFGQVQGALKTGKTPGTVASVFTYTSWWDSPGRAWQEIDIEFLPTRGNVVHTNVIYQPQNGIYQSWEEDISLTPFGLNIQSDVLTIGFAWTSDKISWYVFDSKGNKKTIRTVYRDHDGIVNDDEIPYGAWPVDDTRIMINHWHGDNSADAFYFPGQYYGDAGWAYYDFIEYLPQ